MSRNQQRAEPVVTLGGAWRAPREEGITVELPSGANARLRPVDLAGLVIEGHVPDLLTPTVMELLFTNEQAAADQLTDPKQVGRWAKETLQLYNAVCRVAFVSPRIVDEPQGDDEIAISDVELIDRGYVFSVATQGAAALKSFRFRQDASVEPVPDQQDNEPEAGDPATD